MRALQFSRKPARYAAAMVASRVRAGAGAAAGPLRLRDIDPPTGPTDEWVTIRPRLSGICGSDLSTIDGRTSAYFEPIVSFPFVLGHEVVADVDGPDGTAGGGGRAVLVPVLHCAIRGVEPPCPSCAAGAINHCERIAFGHLEPGLQSGFCADTGGGWSEAMTAHPDQLVPIPGDLSDEAAVMVEPTACAVHAAAAVDPSAGPVAIIGAGTLGLLTVAALPRDTDTIVAARYPHQQRWATELGADRVVDPSALDGAVRLATGSLKLADRNTPGQLTGGAATVVDCVGSEASLTQALQIVAPGGTILVVGMPATTTLDLTGLWHRETRLQGVYAYTRADFDTAIDLVADADLGRLVTATYPLARYRDAVAHAAEAGRRGAVKIAFDLRPSSTERNH